MNSTLKVPVKSVGGERARGSEGRVQKQNKGPGTPSQWKLLFLVGAKARKYRSTTPRVSGPRRETFVWAKRVGGSPFVFFFSLKAFLLIGLRLRGGALRRLQVVLTVCTGRREQ